MIFPKVQRVYKDERLKCHFTRLEMCDSLLSRGQVKGEKLRARGLPTAQPAHLLASATGSPWASPPAGRSPTPRQAGRTRGERHRAVLGSRLLRQHRPRCVREAQPGPGVFRARTLLLSPPQPPAGPGLTLLPPGLRPRQVRGRTVAVWTVQGSVELSTACTCRHALALGPDVGGRCQGSRLSPGHPSQASP